MAGSSDVLKEEEIPSFEELLSGLTDDQVETFSRYLKREEFVPGETIFYQNDPSDSLYIIQVGTVEISKMPEAEGEEYTPLVTLKEGNIFGEISFLTESDRSASAVASTHVVLYRMSRKDFATIVDENPTLACRVYDAVMKVLAYRLRRTDQKLIDMANRFEARDPSDPIAPD